MDDDANQCTHNQLEVAEDELSETDNKDATVSKKLGYNRFMVENVWDIGTQQIEKDDVRSTRVSAKKRVLRKRRINSAVSSHEALRQPDSGFKLEKNVEQAPWKKSVMQTFSKFY